MNALWLWKGERKLMVVLLLRAIKQQLQPHTVSWCQAQNWERHTSGLYTVTCLHNLYAEYTMRNAGLGEAQAGIKIAGRNIK